MAERPRPCLRGIFTARRGEGARERFFEMFSRDWRRAGQGSAGWDRFSEGGAKANALDNASYGHDLEFLMLLFRALDILGAGSEAAAPYMALAEKIVDRVVRYGIDREFGGVFVEGSTSGPATDLQKEFWQQAEAMAGLLEAYEFVHRFVLDRMVTHTPGEWLALLERDGKPVWTHMGSSWKINYHSFRAVLGASRRLGAILAS